MQKCRTNLNRIFLLVIAFVFSSCASVHEPSGFLTDPALLKKGEYFRQEWINPAADFSRYQKVKVNDVELGYFDNSRSNHSQEDIALLSSNFKSALETELGTKYQVLGLGEMPDQETFVVTPALIYVATPERALNVATWWFSYLLISRGFAASKGFAAFEAKITDGATGKILAQIAEKRAGGGGVTDVKSLTVGSYLKFTHAEGAFKAWAKNLVKLLS